MFRSRRPARATLVQVTEIRDLAFAALAHTNLRSQGDALGARNQIDIIETFLRSLSAGDLVMHLKLVRSNLLTLGIDGEKICGRLSAAPDAPTARYWQRLRLNLTATACSMQYATV